MSLPPQKLTWNLEMMVFNRNLLFQGFMFRFHVSFRGCIHTLQIESIHEYCIYYHLYTLHFLTVFYFPHLGGFDCWHRMRLLLSLGPQITQIPEVASVDLLGGCWCGRGLIFLTKLLPGKLTCPLKINGWEMYFLLKYSLLRGHVSFRGCISTW